MRRPGAGPQRRHHPPRHQARQPDGRSAGAPEDPRLRDCARHRRQPHPLRPADPGQHDDRDAGLHVAGAVRGGRDRSPQRHLCRRRGLLRAARLHRSLCRRRYDPGRTSRARRKAGAAVVARARHRSRDRRDHPARAEEGSQQALSGCRDVREGARKSVRQARHRRPAPAPATDASPSAERGRQVARGESRSRVPARTRGVPQQRQGRGQTVRGRGARGRSVARRGARVSRGPGAEKPGPGDPGLVEGGNLGDVGGRDRGGWDGSWRDSGWRYSGRWDRGRRGRGGDGGQRRCGDVRRQDGRRFLAERPDVGLLVGADDHRHARRGESAGGAKAESVPGPAERREQGREDQSAGPAGKKAERGPGTIAGGLLDAAPVDGVGGCRAAPRDHHRSGDLSRRRVRRRGPAADDHQADGGHLVGVGNPLRDARDGLHRQPAEGRRDRIGARGRCRLHLRGLHRRLRAGRPNHHEHAAHLRRDLRPKRSKRGDGSLWTHSDVDDLARADRRHPRRRRHPVRHQGDRLLGQPPRRRAGRVASDRRCRLYVHGVHGRLRPAWAHPDDVAEDLRRHVLADRYRVEAAADQTVARGPGAKRRGRGDATAGAAGRTACRGRPAGGRAAFIVQQRGARSDRRSVVAPEAGGCAADRRGVRQGQDFGDAEGLLRGGRSTGSGRRAEDLSQGQHERADPATEQVQIHLGAMHVRRGGVRVAGCACGQGQDQGSPENRLPPHDPHGEATGQ